jgi:hypothetical protein
MGRLCTSLLLAWLVLTLAACGRSQDAVTAAGLQVTLIPDGSYPGETLVVAVRDEAGQPVTDATVSVEGNMNHAGMTPVLTSSVLDGADGEEDGRYTLPFQFTMLGDWIIMVKITPQDGDTVSTTIDLRATDDSVTVEE